MKGKNPSGPLYTFAATDHDTDEFRLSITTIHRSHNLCYMYIPHQVSLLHDKVLKETIPVQLVQEMLTHFTVNTELKRHREHGFSLHRNYHA